MARVSSLTRLVSLGTLAAMTVLGTLAVPTAASAGGINVNKYCVITGKCGKPQFYMPPGGWKLGPSSAPPVAHHHHGGGWGYGAAAMGGMAVGLIAAGAASANAPAASGECYSVRRQAVDEDGTVYVRRVRVCE